MINPFFRYFLKRLVFFNPNCIPKKIDMGVTTFEKKSPIVSIFGFGIIQNKTTRTTKKVNINNKLLFIIYILNSIISYFYVNVNRFFNSEAS